MRLGLISDTHGWLDPALAEWLAGVAMILHAGDVGSEAVLDALRAIAPTVAVRGNVDGGAWARRLPLETVVEAGALRVAMLHIAGRPRKPSAAARALLAREEPDVLLLGHSHMALAERHAGTLWLNPGAAGRQGFHRERTAMLLETEPLGLELVTLGRR